MRAHTCIHQRPAGSYCAYCDPVHVFRPPVREPRPLAATTSVGQLFLGGLFSFFRNRSRRS